VVQQAVGKTVGGGVLAQPGDRGGERRISGRATGAPHTAITASPMNFSTNPPYRPITVRDTTKYSDSNSRTASGSRDSDNGVNPTRSQNNTEHTRRSATEPVAATASGGPEIATGEEGADSART
jgi:hypothetical protein